MKRTIVLILRPLILAQRVLIVLAVSYLVIAAVSATMAVQRSPEASLRPPVQYEVLPRSLLRSLLLQEDHLFFRHSGVSLRQIKDSFWRNLEAGRVVRGGSTITMQLAKILYLYPERTIWRKIQQTLIALWIEQKLTKDEILQIYLQNIDFGLAQPGITHASMHYFGKKLSELSELELRRLIAAIPNPTDLANQNTFLLNNRITALNKKIARRGRWMEREIDRFKDTQTDILSSTKEISAVLSRSILTTHYQMSLVAIKESHQQKTHLTVENYKTGKIFSLPELPLLSVVNARFSPDGNYLGVIYATTKQRYVLQIFSMQDAQPQLKQLPSARMVVGTSFTSPLWSADSRSVFLRQRSANREILLEVSTEGALIRYAHCADDARGILWLDSDRRALLLKDELVTYNRSTQVCKPNSEAQSHQIKQLLVMNDPDDGTHHVAKKEISSLATVPRKQIPIAVTINQAGEPTGYLSLESSPYRFTPIVLRGTLVSFLAHSPGTYAAVTDEAGLRTLHVARHGATWSIPARDGAINPISWNLEGTELLIVTSSLGESPRYQKLDLSVDKIDSKDVFTSMIATRTFPVKEKETIIVNDRMRIVSFVPAEGRPRRGHLIQPFVLYEINEGVFWNPILSWFLSQGYSVEAVLIKHDGIPGDAITESVIAQIMQHLKPPMERKIPPVILGYSAGAGIAYRLLCSSSYQPASLLIDINGLLASSSYCEQLKKTRILAFSGEYDGTTKMRSQFFLDVRATSDLSSIKHTLLAQEAHGILRKESWLTMIREIRLALSQ